jgi:hypothetical protein
MLFDTDVLIWVFRGNQKAANVVDKDADRCISVVTFMELLEGTRNRQEVRVIKNFLAQFNFQTLPLTENIGHRAAIYMEEYGLKAGMRLADALIAATAVENNMALCTGNQRHYRPVEEVEVRAFRA